MAFGFFLSLNIQMRNHYLQAMGITRWKLRQSFSYYLVMGKVNRGVLIVNISEDPQQRKLLEAILQALNAPLSPLQNLDGLNGLVSIALGNHPATICTHSLKEMLQDNRLKAPVWRILQDFMKKINLQ
jgi:DNA polymerase III psi subunit